MLETVKQLINDSPFITFEQYFHQYVMNVQDVNIDNEVAFMIQNNDISPMLLNQVMNSEVGEYL